MEDIENIIREVKGDIDLFNITNFLEEGIFDSLDIVKMIHAIEKKYGIVIPPEEVDAENFVSVECIKNMVDLLVKNQK